MQTVGWGHKKELENVPVANALGYTSERLWHRMGWFGTVRLLLAIGVCMAAGFMAARLVGFPLYPGWQGVFAQQPVDLAGRGLVMAGLSLAAGLILAMLIAPPADLRMPAVVGATALAGFSIRGGTMGSVMQAAGGREVFWLLCGELAVLSLLLMLVMIVWRMLRSSEDRAPGAAGTVGIGSGVVQLVATAAMVWVLGRSYEKMQALMAVLMAAGVGVWVAHLVTGHVWRWAWCVPLVVGMAGYAANGVWATGVETANIPYATKGFAMPLPLDYAAVGMLGVVLGALATRGEKDEEPATEPGDAAKQG